MKSFLFQLLLAVFFMNFIYPELQLQMNQYRLNGSIAVGVDLKEIQELADGFIRSQKRIERQGSKGDEEALQEASPYMHVDDVREPSTFNSTKNLNTSASRERVIAEGKKYIGVPYAWGSRDPQKGFDCSGFVYYVYKKGADLELPVGSKKQFADSRGTTVSYSELRPGDLMFFSHNGRSIQHVAMYLDSDHFIHAPRSGRRICIESLSRYWRQRFVNGKTFLP